MPKFYVTMTWHDFPEGGSYGNTVTADSYEDAEELIKLEMAETMADPDDDIPASCTNCGNTDQDGSDICPDCNGTDWDPGQDAAVVAYVEYADRWHVIDCCKLEDTTAGQALAEVIKAWEEPSSTVHDFLATVEKAKEVLYG